MEYHHVCSLGTVCHTARFMQRIKVKNVSYPFDWTFSDENIISDCLENRFEKFLDKSYYVDVKNDFYEHNCGHTLYHEDFFFHKDPRRDDHYEYYKRCINRFNDMCNSPLRKLFIVMFSPELTKHPENLHYHYEIGSDKLTIMEDMKQRGRKIDEALKNYTSNYNLCVVMNFGNNEYQTYDFDVEGTIHFLTLNTINPSQGVTFSGGWNTNRHPDNYYMSGLFTELYKFNRI
jgi:hypothetical protein